MSQATSSFNPQQANTLIAQIIHDWLMHKDYNSIIETLNRRIKVEIVEQAKALEEQCDKIWRKRVDRMQAQIEQVRAREREIQT